MRYLQTYKLFESVNDDTYEKWFKIKADYDKGVKEVKDEYLKGVSDCLYDLTDYYDFTSMVEMRDFSKADGEYWRFLGNLVANFKFKVPIVNVENFFDTLIELDDLVKSHVSKHRRIIIKHFDIQISNLYKLEIYSLEDVKSKVMGVLDEPRTKRSDVKFATIQIEI